MKIFKHKETGHTVEVENSNLFSVYVREGYEEVKPVKETKKKK